jgi:serine/threonine protein kinase
MANLLGQSLGRYHILEQLGAPRGCFAKGGMATVYKAYDTRLERDVDIKPTLEIVGGAAGMLYC